MLKGIWGWAGSGERHCFSPISPNLWWHQCHLLLRTSRAEEGGEVRLGQGLEGNPYSRSPCSCSRGLGWWWVLPHRLMPPPPTLPSYACGGRRSLQGRWQVRYTAQGSPFPRFQAETGEVVTLSISHSPSGTKPALVTPPRKCAAYKTAPLSCTLPARQA